MVAKLTKEYVSDYLAQHGCKLLGDYKNSKSKMKCQCRCGEIFVKTFGNFQKSPICQKCAIATVKNRKQYTAQKRYVYDEVSQYFKEHGCELLDNCYSNTITPLRYRCSCGKIATITFANFRRGSRCAECRLNTLKLSYDYVKQYFADHGCELLETEYVNARKKLRYRCSCGNVSSIVFYSFKVGNRCKKCGDKRANEKQRGILRGKNKNLTAAEYFASFGCELLSEYKKSGIPVLFKCKCGKLAKKSLNSFQSSPQCPDCGLLNRSGENHYEWKQDREQYKLDYEFRQKCYKVLKYTLKQTKRTKNKRTKELLGYSFLRLKKRVTSHPNWPLVKDESWHLDHVFPVKAFLDFGIRNIKIINCLENLRPLSGSENSSKGDDYNREDFEAWLRYKRCI